MISIPAIVSDNRYLQKLCECSSGVENEIRAEIYARDGNRDSERPASRSGAGGKPTESCATKSLTSLVRSPVRSKLPSRARGFEQPVCAQNCARDRDRKDGPSERCLRAPGILMISHTCQLLGRVRKPALVQQTRLHHLVLNNFERAAW